MRFERLGEMGDVQNGILSLAEAVRLTPDTQTCQVDLNNLGTSLLRRFERLGEIGDIEKGISSFEDAVRLTPDRHPEKSSFLSNLGTSLLTRFERLEDLGEDYKS